MIRILSFILPAVCTLAIALTASAQKVIYVDAEASGAADGSSWAAAFSSLQDALASAEAGDAVWVAEGTYKPDLGATFSDGDRSAAFVLKSGVRLHGGFAGVESSLTQRTVFNNLTILSGDLSGDDDGFSRRGDNSFHVVLADGMDENTLLDGFVVAGGHANGVGADSLGGGLLVTGGSPVITNTRFLGNYGRCGGAIAIDGGAPQLVNVVASGNRALRGGGVCNLDASAEIINATVTSNIADTGAGLFNRRSSPAVSNSIISGNRQSTSVPDCELTQYPCTIADTPEEIRVATVDLLLEALEVRHNGTMEDAKAFLESSPDVAEVRGDRDALHFRLVGGSPAWLTDVSLGGDAGSSKTRTTRDQTGAGAFEIRTRGPQSGVVGEDSNHDGRVDNRDVKRALMLAPYEWQFRPYDETGLLTDQLMSIPAYEGNIRFVSNPDTFDQNIQLSDYESWQNYDFIFVSTHGGRYCWESEYSPTSRCEVRINSGVKWSSDKVISSPGIDFGAAYSSNVTEELGYSPNLVKLVLNGDFFRNTYGSGLDNAVVIFSACETGGRFASALADDLGADNFVMFGWSETVDSDDGLKASGMLVEEMLKGLAAEEALTKLQEVDPPLTPVLNSEFETTELTRYAPNGGDQRIIELPTLVDNGTEMVDGASIDDMVEGVVGDTEDDILRLDLLVRGVLPETKDQFRIRYEVDGRPTLGVYDLGSATMSDEYAYIVQHEVALGFPLHDGPLTIEAIVDLPEGGESRFQVDVMLSPCFWRLTMGGTRAGEYSGNSAWFSRPIESQFNLQFNPLPSDELISVVVAIVNRSIPPGTVGSYLLGADDVGDGVGQIVFSVGELPNLYVTGDGSEEKDENGNVIFVYPGPSNLTIAHSDSTVVQGEISGTYWAPTNFFPAAFELAPVSLRFRAELSMLPGGTPIFDACGGN